MVCKDIRFFNSQTHRSELFKSIEPDKVRLYTCGPTVYHYAHIGNLRTYIFEDILRRMLESYGYEVHHVMNITDVGHMESNADSGDDKMSVAAKRDNKTPWEVAKFFEEAFFDDCEKLNIRRPTTICRATDHIKDMQDFIVTLIDRDLAYVVDGNVYFNTKKFASPNTFVKINRVNAEQHRRVEPDSRKINQEDFVLWFSQSKFPNQIMKWESPWGVGFPGWHIECSAMASKYLGKRIDIHCGGIDHISIHHANEISQSEGCHGDKWVNYWLHANFLLMDNDKMAKSKGDFITVATLIAKDYDPMHFRYLCLTAHYRNELKFSFESLEAAKNAYTTLINITDDFRSYIGDADVPTDEARIIIHANHFLEAMYNDLNTPTALSAIWECLRDERISKKARFNFFVLMNEPLGLVNWGKKIEMTTQQQIWFDERELARKSKNFQRADEIRELLEKTGLILKDRPDGTDWKVAKNSP